MSQDDAKVEIMKKFVLVSQYRCSSLSACQTTDYSGITDEVRLAITYADDSKRTIISTRIEMRDQVTEKWFEAGKQLSADIILPQKEPQRGSNSGHCGCGGGGRPVFVRRSPEERQRNYQIAYVTSIVSHFQKAGTCLLFLFKGVFWLSMRPELVVCHF